MPVWHERTHEWVKQGRLKLLGITQEQHPERCRLFAQWKGFDWQILHDPINVMEALAVPIFVAIDEHGIVRAVGPKPDTIAETFLNQSFTDEALEARPTSGRADPDLLIQKARTEPSDETWRAVGDALSIWGGASRATEAIDAYRQSIVLDPTDGRSFFRLGVAYRSRHESPERRTGDFQAAVDSWGKALELDPNQYIWRRRIEQYGPRLAKPYPFYDWVEIARAEITARGESPLLLPEEPQGSELAPPTREVAGQTNLHAEPDPNARILRDQIPIVEVEVSVVPSKVKPGRGARIHLNFRPSQDAGGHWNNELTPLQIWISPPEGWSTSERFLEWPRGTLPESDEVRRFDFEVKAPRDAEGKIRIPAYALYSVCEATGGRCLFLRRDLTLEVEVTP